MQIYINKNELEVAVLKVSKAITEKTSLPILTCIKMEVNPDAITLTGGDSDVIMHATARPASVEGEGTVCIHAQSLREVLSPLSEQLLTLDVSWDDNMLTVTHDHGNMRIPIQDAAAYPAPPVHVEDTAVTLPCRTLVEALRRAIWTTAIDEIRLIMTGVCVHFTPTHTDIVGTNGRCLMRSRIEGAGDNEAEYVIPRRAAKIISDICQDKETVEMRFGQKQCLVDVGDCTMTAVLIEGNYPNYNAVIPRESRVELHAATRDVALSLRRALPNLDRSLLRAILTTEADRVTLTGRDDLTGRECFDSFAATVEGDTLSLGVNASLLLSVIGNMQTEHVRLQMSDPSRPLVVTPVEPDAVDTLAIVMPLRTD